MHYLHKDRTERCTLIPKPRTEVDARTITSEIITANDIWDFQLEPWNLQILTLTTDKRLLFQPLVFILRRPQNLNEVKFV